MTFRVIDAPQRSPEWYAARAGRLTGSCAAEMLAKIKSGEAAGRRNLRVRLLLERLTGRPQDSGFVSPAMQDGIDREAAALAAFEAVSGDLVTRTGFLASLDHQAGCSLDGHLGNFEALLSIKCRQPAAHLDFLRSGKIPGDALAQMRHELWIVPQAKEHLYFSWNPDFPPDLQYRMVSLRREAADIPGYEREVLTFLAEVDREVEAVQTMRDLPNQLTASIREVA